MSGKLLALTAPVDSASADEFNRWYDEVHVPQVKSAVPGITDVERFVFVDPAAGGAPTTRYLCLYHIEGEVMEAAAALGAASANGTLDQTPTMDVADNPPELLWAQAL